MEMNHKPETTGEMAEAYKELQAAMLKVQDAVQRHHTQYAGPHDGLIAACQRNGMNRNRAALTEARVEGHWRRIQGPLAEAASYAGLIADELGALRPGTRWGGES